MSNINPDQFKITGPVQLSALATEYQGGKIKDPEEELDDVRRDIAKIQERMFAHNRYSVLICFQGMDTSGKDSLIREVFKDINPRGIIVHGFKAPGAAELEHDYIWRHYLALPEKGRIAVFNRTHYENVLVTRVHPEYLLKENIPGIEKVEDVTAKFWERRMEQIRNFEKHIVENGTIVLKFYLHLSKEEQKNRLLRRLEEEKHNWKFSVGDLEERELWDDYMKYYEEAINKTSTDYAPWHVVPADDKDLCRLIVAEIINNKLEGYKDIVEPELDEEVANNLRKYRRHLEDEQ